MSFNGKLRDELLNGEIFYTLKEAKVLIERWRTYYNTIRPHSSLGYRPPAPETVMPTECVQEAFWTAAWGRQSTRLTICGSGLKLTIGIGCSSPIKWLMLLTKPKFAGCFDFCPVVFDHEDLSGDILLCVFGPIVPKETLVRFRVAYNVHPGPITYPGRDPHHWALFEGAEWFGVTLHEMIEQVDQGTVLRTDPFPIATSDPLILRDQANERAIKMMNKWGPMLLDGTFPFPPMAEDWCGPVHRRRDLLNLIETGVEADKQHALKGFL
jgi:hypothetical protein